MPTALITGASHGIGKAIATEFARHSYHLVINCARSADALHALASQLIQEYHISCFTCIGDVSNPDFVSEMFQIGRAHV